MDGTRIRQATPKDLDTLLRFEQGIIAAERPFDTTIKRQQTNYYDLPSMLSSKNVFIAIAEQDGIPIGCGYARKEAAKPYLQHQWHAYLGFMYVVPAYRGRGINRKVMDVLKKWAAAQDLTEIRLEVYSENLSALKAYEKAGFSSLLLEMRMSVEGEAGA